MEWYILLEFPISIALQFQMSHFDSQDPLFMRCLFPAIATNKKSPKAKINKSSKKFFPSVESLLQIELDFIVVKVHSLGVP